MAGPFAILTQDANRAQVLGVWADGSALIAVATPDGTTGKVFLSGNHSFSYVRDDGGRRILCDEATGSEWDGFEGRSISGPLFRDPAQGSTFVRFLLVRLESLLPRLHHTESTSLVDRCRERATVRGTGAWPCPRVFA